MKKEGMKRFIALVLTVSLSLLSVGGLADTLDLSVLEDNDLIKIDINDDGHAFVKSIIGFTPFTHEDEVEDYASYVYSDIIIADYYSQDPVISWRFWVSYSAHQYLDISSFTIVLDDNEYTFANVGHKDHMTDYGTNVREYPHVNFGGNNVAFWRDLLLKWETLENKAELFDMSVPMILHGAAKDVKVEVSGYALVDLIIMGQMFLQMAGLDTLLAFEGNEVSVVNHNSGESGTGT